MSYRWNTEKKILDPAEVFVHLFIIVLLAVTAWLFYTQKGFLGATVPLFLLVSVITISIPRLLAISGLLGSIGFTLDQELLVINDVGNSLINWYMQRREFSLDTISFVGLVKKGKSRGNHEYGINIVTKEHKNFLFGTYLPEDVIRKFGVAIHSYVPLSNEYAHFCGIYSTERTPSLQDVIIDKAKAYVGSKAKEFWKKKFGGE